MDKLSSVDLPPLPQSPTFAPRKPAEAEASSGQPVYAADTVDAQRMRQVVQTAQAKPAALDAAQREKLVEKKATCPFIGSAIASQALPVRNNQDKPLASIDDVVALGNSGGGDLGEVLKIFAQGNHAMMPGLSGAMDMPAPPGLFSLDFPGSQGSHPGHSGILQGNPKELDSGRFSQQDFDRLLSKARDGYVTRSDIARFIAENLAKDPQSKVLGPKAAGLVLGDLGRFVSQTGPTLLEKLQNRTKGTAETTEDRKLYETLTKTLGEDNLVGSSGEFGLLMAFLANSPRTRTIGGEPAVSVDDLKAMFQEHRLPDGWQSWPKTKLDWVTNTTALMVEAGKDYLRLKG